MQLLVIEHGTRRLVSTQALRPGKEGNLQTLAELLPMIRRDVEDEELRNFALELIADCDNSFESQVGTLFQYAQKIRFVRDPIDAERIADAWTTIGVGAGDCGDKSELLAALLGSVGYVNKLRALNFFDDLATHGYDHLLVRVQRDDTGEWISLDPTPERAAVGFEPQAPVVTDFDIWPEGGMGVSGIFDDLINQGIQLGTQYAAGQVARARVTKAQERQLGRDFDASAGEVTALFNRIQSQAVITQTDLERALAAYQQLAQWAEQYGSVEYISQQWNSSSYRPAYEQRLHQIADAMQRPASGGTTSSGGTTTTTGGGGGGVLDSVLPPSVSSALSNPLAIVAIGLLAVAAFRGENYEY